METLSDYEDADNMKLLPETSAPPAMKPFNADLDPSDPLRFLEEVFDFFATESDMSKIDSLENYSNEVAVMMLDKMEMEEEKRKRKKVKIEGDGKAERNTEKEVLPLPSPVKNEEMKEVEKSEIKVEEEKDWLRAPNKGNGLDMGNYSWGQTSEYVNLTIPVPPGTVTRDITCEIRTDRIKFGLKGQPPVLDGELCQPIKVVDSSWKLDDEKPVSIFLTKQDTTQKDWWKYIVKGEPEIDTQKVKTEETTLHNVDPARTAALVKLLREDMLKKYQAKRLVKALNIWRAKINQRTDNQTGDEDSVL